MPGKRSRGPWTLESMEKNAAQSVDASMDLGRRYHEGDGVEQSDADALRCFLQAVALRDAPPPAPSPAAPTPRDFNDVDKDVACLVFAHLRRVRDRVSLSRVSKVWRDASKEAASLPDKLFMDARRQWRKMAAYLMQHDGVLTLPEQRVHDLLESLCWCGENPCVHAAAAGELELLKWLRQHGYTWTMSTCRDAAYGRHLHVLKWAHENGAPWDECTADAAALRKHWHILRYAIDNGCPGAERYK
jgi:hypothetical protein